MSESQLYVHLIPQTTNEITETIKVNLNQDSLIDHLKT